MSAHLSSYQKDKGQSDAMNKGIAMAKGLVMGTLNVDDYYEPNVLCPDT